VLIEANPRLTNGGAGTEPGVTPVFRAISLATGAERVIKAGTFPGDTIGLSLVSPDGRRIAYSVERGNGAELRAMNTDGSGDRVLLPMANGRLAPEPVAWSHDGRFLLYDPDGGGSHARVLNVSTGESWALLEKSWPTWSKEGSWAPDGSSIVVTVSSERWVSQLFQGITYEAVAKLMKK
jgi:Tol biopolymer transport system component